MDEARAKLTKTAGKAAGDAAYAALFWQTYRFEKEAVFKTTGTKYEDIKEFFESRAGNVESANYYCLYACIAGDRATAKRLFQKIGTQWDSECWGSNENFEKRKKKYG